MASYNGNGEMVVGIGEVLWDLLPDGKKIGGAPANFAFHAGQCGLPSCVVSAIGHDDLGSEAMKALTLKNLPFTLEEVDYPTGTVPVTLDENGVPTYEIREGVAWDNIPFTPAIENLAKRTRAVSFGSLAQRAPVSRQTIRSFLDAMPKNDDRFIIFDVNLRQNFYTAETLQESLNRCNIMKINDEELVILGRLMGYPGIDLKDKCWLILGKYNLKMLVLTCGINGSYVFSPGHVSFLPTPVVNVVDTVGAGDAFSGAFVASILKGCSIEKAHHNAIKVSAFVCTQPGAMPTLTPELIDQITSR